MFIQTRSLDHRRRIGTTVEYLLRAHFDAADQGFADAQVLDTVAEGVEAGQLTVVEVDGTLAIVSNKCAFTAQGTPEWGDQGLCSGAITRALGRGLLHLINRSTVSNNGFLHGWATAMTLDHPEFVYSFNHGTSQVNYWNGASNLAIGDVLSLGTDYQFGIVLGGYDANGVPWRSGQTVASYDYGATLYIKGGAYSAWTIVWRDSADNTATLYASWSNMAEVGTLDDFRVPDVDLSAVLQPIAFSTFTAANDTSLDAITPEVGGAWTEQAGAWDIQSNRPNPDGAAIATVDASVADVLLSCVVNGAAADNPAIVLRFSNTSNYWYLQADRANNNLELHEYAATVDTIRAQDTDATINDSTDYTLVAIADGQDISGFLNGGDKVSYASAALNETATIHGIRAENTAGRFDNFHVHGRTDVAYDALDKV